MIVRIEIDGNCFKSISKWGANLGLFRFLFTKLIHPTLCHQGIKNLDPIYCHCKNPRWLHIKHRITHYTINTSKTNPIRQIQVENTNSMTIKIIWKSKWQTITTRNSIKQINKLKWKRKQKNKINKQKRKIKRKKNRKNK